MHASSGVRLSVCVAARSSAILARLQRGYEAESCRVMKSHFHLQTWADVYLCKSSQVEGVHLLIAVGVCSMDTCRQEQGHALHVQWVYAVWVRGGLPLYWVSPAVRKSTND